MSNNRPPIDPERMRLVREWLRSHGVDTRLVPLHGPVVVQPLNEGAFQLDYRSFVHDALGNAVPASDGTDLLTDGRVLVVDTPPPGYAPARSLVWRGHDWIRRVEEAGTR